MHIRPLANVPHDRHGVLQSTLPKRHIWTPNKMVVCVEAIWRVPLHLHVTNKCETRQRSFKNECQTTLGSAKGGCPSAHLLGGFVWIAGPHLLMTAKSTGTWKLKLVPHPSSIDSIVFPQNKVAKKYWQDWSSKIQIQWFSYWSITSSNPILSSESASVDWLPPTKLPFALGLNVYETVCFLSKKPLQIAMARKKSKRFSRLTSFTR